MTRTLFATVLSAALALGAMAPAPAHAASDDMKKLLGGIATVVILGATYDHFRDKAKRHEPAGRHPHRPRHHDYRDRPARIVPAQCLQEIRTRHGSERFYGKRCLERTMRAARHLPRACQIRVRSRDGERVGYAPRCLHDYGWRRG